MLKTKLMVGAIGLSLLTACQYGAEGDPTYRKDETGTGSTLNVLNRNEQFNQEGNSKEDQSANFGYTRLQKKGVTQDANFIKTPVMDRDKTAKSISSLVIQLPNIEDVATLVTDEEVLVAYETTAKDRFEAADQVKKTAISFVPRYYHVYVSDKPAMIRQIQSYSPLETTNRDIDQILTNTIKEMLKSPQGRALNKGENPNGEGYGEMNEELDDDMKDNYQQTRYKNNK